MPGADARASHTARRRRRGHGDLDAVLARVAGAGDGARHALPRRRAATSEAADGRGLRPHRRQPLGAPAAPARRARRASCVVSAPPIASTHPVGVRRVRHHVEHVAVAVGRVPPHDDVVEHRARRRRRAGGCTAPDRGRSCRGRWSARAAAGRSASAPSTRTVPRWRHVEHDRVACGRRGARRSCPPGTRAASPSRRTAPCGRRARDGRRRAASARASYGVDGSQWPAPAPARRRRRHRARKGASWASMSSFTPASGSTLSTPWPLAHDVDQLVVRRTARPAAADDDVGAS